MSRDSQKPTKIESKAAVTDVAAREIIDRDHKSQDAKTDRLRAARLEREEATRIEQAAAKPRAHKRSPKKPPQ